MKSFFPVRRFQIGLLFALLSILWISAASHAGGWVVTTLEALPADVQAGQPIHMDFMVRQHGQTPVHLAEAYLHMVHQETGELMQIAANPVAPEGRHRVTVTFPHPGVWVCTFVPSPFAANGEIKITVIEGDRRPKSPPSTGFSSWLDWLRQWFAHPGRAQTQSPTLTPVEQGKILFVAKGCVSCHRHDQVVVPWSTAHGRDLSNYSAEPDFVHHWLRNAWALTAGQQWRMPTLELGDSEIDALVAFLVRG